MIPGEKAEATPPWREAASINNDNSSVGRMISTDLLLILVIVVCPSYFAEEIRRCPACVEVRSRVVWYLLSLTQSLCIWRRFGY